MEFVSSTHQLFDVKATAGDDWIPYRDSMTEACTKENAGTFSSSRETRRMVKRGIRRGRGHPSLQAMVCLVGLSVEVSGEMKRVIARPPSADLIIIPSDRQVARMHVQRASHRRRLVLDSPVFRYDAQGLLPQHLTTPRPSLPQLPEVAAEDCVQMCTS